MRSSISGGSGAACVEGGLPAFEIEEVSVSAREGNVPGNFTSGMYRMAEETCGFIVRDISS